MKSLEVIGIDEVGRGPIAGPVTVCAFYTNNEKLLKKIIFDNTIRDSKKLTKHIRNKIYLTIRNLRKNKIKDLDIEYSVISRSAEYIDRHGINKAIQSCIATALRNLQAKYSHIERVIYKLDGGLKLPIQYINQSTYIRGDENHASIALASIMAKVTRDRYMEKMSKENTGYDWQNNVGYGTKKHYVGISTYGLSKLHRASFIRVSNTSNKQKD
jgi:ribonuclease HII